MCRPMCLKTPGHILSTSQRNVWAIKRNSPTMKFREDGVMIRQSFQSVCCRWHDAIFSREKSENLDITSTYVTHFINDPGGKRENWKSQDLHEEISRISLDDWRGACLPVMFLYVTFPSSPTPHRVSPPNAARKTYSLLSWNINATKLINYWFSPHTPTNRERKNFCTFNYFIHQTLNSLQLWTLLFRHLRFVLYTVFPPNEHGGRGGKG